MSSKNTSSVGQAFFADLLLSEEGQKALREIWTDLTTKRKHRITSVDCPRCKEWKRVDIMVDKYSMREINDFVKFAASFGISKPAQVVEQTSDVRVSHELQALENASIDELREIAGLS